MQTDFKLGEEVNIVDTDLKLRVIRITHNRVIAKFPSGNKIVLMPTEKILNGRVVHDIVLRRVK